MWTIKYTILTNTNKSEKHKTLISEKYNCTSFIRTKESKRDVDLFCLKKKTNKFISTNTEL